MKQHEEMLSKMVLHEVMGQVIVLIPSYVDQYHGSPVMDLGLSQNICNFDCSCPKQPNLPCCALTIENVGGILNTLKNSFPKLWSCKLHSHQES